MIINKLRPDHVLDFAAEELKKYLRMMQPEGGEIEIAYDPAATDGYRLGLCADFGIETEAKDPVLDDVLHIDADAEGGIIAGSNPRSVLMAVYRFLRENGCRWLYPGIDGEYIPVRAIEPTKYHKMADHRFRGVCNEGAESQQCMMDTIDFNPNVGMNVYMIEFDNPFTYYNSYYTHAHNPNRPKEPVSYEQVKQWKRLCEAEMSKRGLQFHDMGHGWTADPFGLDSTEGWAVTDQEIPAETVQFLALRNGKRELFGGVPLNTNLCMSNPAVQKIMATAIADYAETHQNVDFLHVWLADGSRNHCECAECQKMRPTDYYLMIMNQLDEMLTARGLKTRIVFISYVDTLWGPEQVTIKNPERFSLLYAPITRTYTQSANGQTARVEMKPYLRNQWETPKSIEDNLALLRDWQRTWKGPCFSYEYHFWRHQYHDPGALYIARRIYEDIRGLREVGIDGYVEDGSQRSFFPNGLAMTTYAETLFDRERSFDAIVEDYFSHAYGENWKTVAEYLQKVSDTFDFAYVAGECSTDEAISHWYDPARVPALEKVAELVKTCPVRPEGVLTRVQAVSYRLLELHRKYCPLLAAALIEKAKGNEELAHDRWLELCRDFGVHEVEIERYYDHCMAMRTFKRHFFKKDYQSLVTGF